VHDGLAGNSESGAIILEVVAYTNAIKAEISRWYAAATPLFIR